MARAWAALCCLALLFSLVLLTPAKIAHASANVEALVEPPSVSIHIALKGVNASLYALMRSHPKAFNETTVPEAVKAFMLANGYEEVNYTETTIGFDDATWTVEISFKSGKNFGIWIVPEALGGSPDNLFKKFLFGFEMVMDAAGVLACPLCNRPEGDLGKIKLSRKLPCRFYEL